MNIPPRQYRAALVGAATLAALLGGCGGGLLPKPPERQLYRIETAVPPPAGLPHLAAQLAIAMPRALNGLDTRRIALHRSAVTLDYFADAEWADQVPFLVRDALVASFERSGAVAAVGPEGLGLRADLVLETAIRDFEAVYDSANAAPKAVVTFNLDLVRLPEHNILAETLVHGEAAAAGKQLPDIVAAFNAALTQAVQQTVSWTVGNPALSPKREAVISRSRSVHPAKETRP